MISLNEQFEQHPFQDAFVNEQNGISVCYRSGKTVYEEQLSGKSYVSAGWNGAGFPLNVLDNCPTRLNPRHFALPQAFDLEANGIALTHTWIYRGFEKTSEQLENGTGILHCKVTLSSDRLPLRAEIHTLLDGTSVLTRYLILENTGPDELNIGRLCIMGGGLEAINRYDTYQKQKDAGQVWSLGYFDFATWAHEGAFSWHRLQPEMTTIFGRLHRPRHRHPMFVLRNNLLGTIYMAQLAYSGAYAMQIDCNVENMEKTDTGIAVSFGICINDTAPVLILKAGERWRSPEVHMGMMNGDLDDIVNEMHTHTRRTVFTLPDATKNIPGGLIEAGIGAERVMDLAAHRQFADTAAMVGAETLTIDAGWYCPPGLQGKWFDRAGDWNYDTDLYPNGIGEIRDYVHSKGLLFGMWLDAERLGKDSAMAAAHPDWIAKPFGQNGSSLIDMTNPEAVAWVEKQVEHLVEDYRIDLFRLDYNIGTPEMQYNGTDGAAAYPRYFDAVCAMYERLRRKYPDVVFENCAGGGGRTDLGFIRYFTHTWVTDWQIAPRSAAITNGMTLCIPPEYVDRLVSGMRSHTAASLDFMVRHTLFGRPTTNDYNPIGSAYNEGQLAFIRHSFDLYKEYVRPYATTGKIYHHTPECTGPAPQGTLIMERTDADRTVGILGVFTLADTVCEDLRVYPRGIDPAKTYAVLFDNSGKTVTLSGWSLLNDGVRISIRNSLSSELLAWRETGI